MNELYCNIATFAIVVLMAFAVVMTNNPYYEVAFVFIASIHVRMRREQQG